MAKTFSLKWAFESFQDEPTFYTKNMFGGLAAYVHDKIVMVLTESPKDRKWREKTFSFDIWNGILFPTEREHHDALQKEFTSLIQHPVLPKWLYLKITDPDFENTVEIISQFIAKNDLRFGVYPKMKKKPKKS